MIKPSVGRVVWYHPKTDEKTAAIVACVHNDTCVNLMVIDQAGNTQGRISVILWQGEGTHPPLPFCEWMPYQKGQAAKAEALEAELKK